MLAFVNDYCECAHPAILSKIAEINYEKNPGYGFDQYSQSATEKIRKACDCPEAEVFYLVGGTQTNQIVIDTMLKPYEGVFALPTGHVSIHEAGAIEFTGHKVINVTGKDYKVQAEAVKEYMDIFLADDSHEHMVQPGMVYISHPTEYGTLYSKEELEALRKVCDAYGLSLYMDGARMAYALASDGSDVTLADIARLTDAFYIGGTKCGALFGEALVFTKKKNVPPFFMTQIKQHGALLAKGFLTGLQFDVLFTDGLYEKLGKNAIDTAIRLKEGMKAKGYEIFQENPTNQTLVVLENKQMEELAKKINFSFWERYDDTHTVVRFCTSWGTKMEDIEEVISLL